MTKIPKTPAHHGGKIGPRIADLTARAMTAHLHKSAHVRAQIGAQAGVHFFKTITAEAKAHGGQVLRDLADHPEAPAELKPLLTFMAHGEGELQALLAAKTFGETISTGISSGLANYLAPLNQDMISKAPFDLLPTDALVALVHKGFWSKENAHSEAAKGGLNGPRFNSLLDAAQDYPDLGILLDAVNRGELPEKDALDLIRRLGFPAWLNATVLDSRHQVLQPADVALMTLRGILTTEQGRARAAKTGMKAPEFDLLTEVTGEPPGIMELLEAYRRGFVDKARLERGIRQSRVRNEWIDVVEKLRYAPPSTSDAVRAVVQNQIEDSAGRKIADENGMDPKAWDWLVKTEGNPLSMGEMLQLYNRGIVTEAQVKQAIRESRTKNKYVDIAFQLHKRIAPERTVVSMIGHGVITHERGVELLRSQGFDGQSAKELVAQGSATKTVGDKHLAKADVLTLYHDHAITEAAASKMLSALGYHGTEATWLLKMADLRRESTERNQAIAVIRSAYLARHIGAEAAKSDLSGAGVAADQVSFLLKLWKLELSTKRRVLTEAQVIHAMKKGVFTVEQTQTRLVGMGYAAADAKVLIDSV